MQQRQDGDDTERLQQPTPHQQPKGLGVDQADQQAIRSQHQDAQSGQQQAFLVVGQRGLNRGRGRGGRRGGPGGGHGNDSRALGAASGAAWGGGNSGVPAYSPAFLSGNGGRP